MATIIKLKIDGIQEELMIPSVGYSLSSSVDLSNPNQQVRFSPVQVSEMSFSIESPKPETVTKLLEWITNHELKKDATISIFDEAITKNARVITLNDVCLTSLSETMDSNYSSLNLSIAGRKFKLDGVEIDLSKTR